MHESGCRVTLLTPAGRGAIATISVSGDRAVAVVDRFFRPFGSRGLDSVPPGRILAGHWRSLAGPVEEVVVARCAEQRVEIHCHGGMAASEAVLQALESAGAAVASSDRWLADQVADPVQRDAWRALAAARTERAAGILLDQWRGALAAALREVRTLLAERPPLLDRAGARVATLLQWSELGLHLCQPWRVVLAGPPNVGKSCLINALLGYERSIVFDQPGTTRDVLTATTAIDGWPVELIDTAGCRDSTDPVEQEGARRAWRELQQADLAVVVVEARDAGQQRVAPWCSAARASLVVANKIDLVSAAATVPAGWLPTCAVTGAGVDRLVQAIGRKLLPDSPPPGAAVPFTRRQVEQLQQANAAIASGDAGSADALLQTILAANPKCD